MDYIPNYDQEYIPDDDYSQVPTRKPKAQKPKKPQAPILKATEYASTWMRQQAERDAAILDSEKTPVQSNGEKHSIVHPVHSEVVEVVPSDPRLACEDRISKAVVAMKDAHSTLSADLHEAQQGSYHISAGFSTFDAYTLDKWGIGKRQAYYLTSGFEAIQALLEDAPELTQTASMMSGKQIKALTKVPREKRVKVVKDLSETGNLTTKAIEAVIVETTILAVDKETQDDPVCIPRDPSPTPNPGPWMTFKEYWQHIGGVAAKAESKDADSYYRIHSLCSAFWENGYGYGQAHPKPFSTKERKAGDAHWLDTTTQAI